MAQTEVYTLTAQTTTEKGAVLLGAFREPANRFDLIEYNTCMQRFINGEFVLRGMNIRFPSIHQLRQYLHDLNEFQAPHRNPDKPEYSTMPIRLSWLHWKTQDIANKSIYDMTKYMGCMPFYTSHTMTAWARKNIAIKVCSHSCVDYINIADARKLSTSRNESSASKTVLKTFLNNIRQPNAKEYLYVAVPATIDTIGIFFETQGYISPNKMTTKVKGYLNSCLWYYGIQAFGLTWNNILNCPVIILEIDTQSKECRQYCSIHKIDDVFDKYIYEFLQEFFPQRTKAILQSDKANEYIRVVENFRNIAR